MMKSCTSPFSHTSNPVFFVTNVILLPVFFGIGGIGNIITIIVLNQSHLRTQSAVYVYVSSLAALDLLTLLLTLPGLLRDLGLLSLQVGYSRPMAQFSTMEYGFSNMCNHASVWMVGLLCLVHYILTCHSHRKSWWIRFTVSRIIIFVAVLCCIVLDFPRFFELKVSDLRGHCFNFSLWKWEVTEFGTRPSYTYSFPWIVSISCFLVPYFLAILFGTILFMQLKFWRVLQKVYCDKSHTFAYPRQEYEMHLVLAAIITSFLLLELPYACAQLALGLDAHIVKSHSDFVLISRCFSLLRCSITFFLFLGLSDDFRKTLRRTFCCCCITEDEYYEPLTCSRVLSWFRQEVSPEHNSQRSSLAEENLKNVFPESPSFRPASAYCSPRTKGRNQPELSDKPIWV